MKKRSIGLCVVLVVAGAVSLGRAQGGRGGPNVPPDELKMAQAIAAAPDAAAKVKAGTDFIKKYPKSVLRPRVARGLADEISRVTDATQKADISRTYQAAFQEPAEQELIMPILIEGLAQSKRADEIGRASCREREEE